MPGEERDAFLDAVRRTPAQLRALLAELDGAVDVVGGSEACLSADACEDVDGERASVGMAVSASREVIVHELGHVVFDLALDERGRRAFRSAFIRTGWDNARFVPVSEQFADQVEHWALGEASSDPRWLSGGELASLLRAHASVSPALGPRPAPTLARDRLVSLDLAGADSSPGGQRHFGADAQRTHEGYRWLPPPPKYSSHWTFGGSSPPPSA